ncbi:hypothetical protein [Photobacterium alginatilyticum]|uniref:Uncharacterized protein n=1 Tax=Photobacterium alginatilyticum TaxID=1775171 RepID=A0ABW9YRW3_9GAMM|nr:hypothetical protein [Photobacterium alginatilyticum]NBI56110.1 hypothetical protein [Photobacterium alginatilyticum]
MPKFMQGETSSMVIDRKNAITKSIRLKSELIDKIECSEDIPSSLEMKKNSISQTSVHKWNDSKLGVIAYSRNSAHADHNIKVLRTLIESINNANKKLLKTLKPEKKYGGESATRLSQNEVNNLKEENEELRVALAEVYRAYMQLLDEHREDRQIDTAYRKLILAQAKILGRNRVWGVK